MRKVRPACLLHLLVLTALAPYRVGAGLATSSLAKAGWRALSTLGYEAASQAERPPKPGGTRPPAKQAYPRELPEIKRETPELPVAPAKPPKYGFVRGRVADVSCKPAPDIAELTGKESLAGKPAQTKGELAGKESLAGKSGKDSRPTAVILSIEAKSRTFRFFKDDLSRIAMVSGPEQGSVCESLGRTTSVNYLVRPDKSGFDGEIMSFELAAKEKPPVEPMRTKAAGKAVAPAPKLFTFSGRVEKVSCARPMVFTLRGNDRSGKVRVMKLRATSSTEFFAAVTKGSPPESFNACESKGLAARATFRPLPPGGLYDGELTRVDFAWSRK